MFYMMTSTGTNPLLSLFKHGKIELEGQFMLGSNYTFLVRIEQDGNAVQAVYKPSRGEQPLWDFPDHTLALREVAAYLVSEALGWNFVPVTVLREDGPYGPGSLQEFIEFDPNYHYFTFSEKDRQRLRPVALFDLLVNNADRKGSHVLIEGKSKRLLLIDHGLCFHEQDKLRTVIWDFAGERFLQELCGSLENLVKQLAGSGNLRASLEPYLSSREIAALGSRAELLLKTRIYPAPPEERRAFPWPPV